MHDISFRLLDSEEEIIRYILSISESLFNQRYNDESFLKRICHKYYFYGNVICLFEDNIDPIGVCAYYTNDMINYTGFISLIAVDNKYQRMGYGKQLLREVIKRNQEAGMKELRLEVDSRNKAAIDFYRRNGFVFCGNSKDGFFYSLQLEKQ